MDYSDIVISSLEQLNKDLDIISVKIDTGEKLSLYDCLLLDFCPIMLHGLSLINNCIISNNNLSRK